MKLQFTVQQYQTDAVNSVVDCFAGQQRVDPVRYRIDPGTRAQQAIQGDDDGFRNAALQLSHQQLLSNVQQVQSRQNLTPSPALVPSKAGPLNLDIEMETGTGKTYVYIKTILELHQRYGWSKYIVVVPSVAIREGVKKTFDITAEHFQQAYGTKPRSFVYNSGQLHELESYSSDAGVQVMIINIQAFNSKGRDNRRIYDERDDFHSRKPIDVVAANRPIVIIDEPQKISSDTSLASLANFDPLLLLRYSATHKTEHNKVHRLDALDAYQQKLVKKIAVRGITVSGLAGSTAYLYLDTIEVRPGSKPTARVELEVRSTSGAITRQVKRLELGHNLFELSGGIAAYRPGGQPLIVTDIDAVRNVVELNSGDTLSAGQLTADATEETKRRIQIREVIRAHLDKERELHGRGIKVLSLFFIDQVAKYRDYTRADTLGEYARAFETEYATAVADHLAELPLDPAYRAYLDSIPARDTHQGYFSIDKNKRQVDGEINRTGDEKGQSKDVDAYDLILKHKERLLSFPEKTRFIFSHSALREGWDNPNVFVMGMLKKSDNTVSRRQEIGRGLRLAVNQQGERITDAAIVHDVNELTVVTDESYTAFVDGLQKEISDSLKGRPRVASQEYFTGKTIQLSSGASTIEPALARAIYRYLLQNDYLNDDDTLSEAYKVARAEHAEISPKDPALAPPVIDAVWPVVDALYIDVPRPDNSRTTKQLLPNKNIDKAEFLALWNQINHKAIYQVEFDSAELVAKAVRAVDEHLTVDALQYVVEHGTQNAELSAETLASGEGFTRTRTSSTLDTHPAASGVQYDLIGEIAKKTQLTRRTVGAILTGIRPDTFAKYPRNPEQFIARCARLISEQKATAIIEHLTYDVLDTRYDRSIFTQNQGQLRLDTATPTPQRHIYDYVVADSQVERSFVTALDTSDEVVVYAKLPRGFAIPTPVGNYNPDWAVAFHEGSVKHVYFVAETKGSLSTLQLRGVEESKIECARKFFATLNAKASADQVSYDVVTDFAQLRQLVG
ncbi:type III restriction-modification system endonuclease [Modestobacter lapidis]|nr:DEAD/DEAH box helicase family protein [Modestobacter lapidis]